MENFLAVIWNPDTELCRLLGLPIRYYSLMWVIGLVAAYIIVKKVYKDRGIKEETFEPLFLYCFIGILAGARLGHCIFYEPEYYLTSGKHFIEMLLPIRFLPQGGIKMVGYSGLASHGGTIGIIIGMILYCRKYKVKVLECIDMVCVATPLTAACIRLGNLMNSEIVGKPTGTDWVIDNFCILILIGQCGISADHIAVVAYYNKAALDHLKTRRRRRKKDVCLVSFHGVL